MEIISGTQEYDIKANWKLLVENSVDDYHLVTTHSTWLNYMRNSGVNVTPAKGHMLPTKGFGKDLGNGHLTTDNPNYRGRPVARWIPCSARRPRPTSTRSAKSWSIGWARPAPRASPIPTATSASSPISSSTTARRLTVRHFTPVAPDLMHVTAWALGPVEETEAQRARGLHAFLTFYGPAALPRPTTSPALELAQQWLCRVARGAVDGPSRGMGSSQGSSPPTKAISACSGANGNEMMETRA